MDPEWNVCFLKLGLQKRQEEFLFSPLINTTLLTVTLLLIWYFVCKHYFQTLFTGMAPIRIFGQKDANEFQGQFNSRESVRFDPLNLSSPL